MSRMQLNCPFRACTWAIEQGWINLHSWVDELHFRLKYLWSQASIERSSLPSNAASALNLLSHSSKWLWYIFTFLLYLLTSSPLLFYFLPLADDPASYFMEKTKAIRKSSLIFPPQNLQTGLPLYLQSLYSLLLKWKECPRIPPIYLLKDIALANIPFLLYQHFFRFLLEVSLSFYFFNILYFPTISKSCLLILNSKYILNLSISLHLC